MKHFLSKVKKCCRNFINGKAAFSLVELIVVIAIMAVMAAVLAPALLGYVEKSRMQKDDSAMDEVVNAMQLSLADQEIYDEVLEHSVWDNVSCYIDKKDESQFADCKVQLKTEHGDKKEQYMFGDEARLLDETVYYAAGNMRGLTITFSPSESGDTYDFANGILNKFVGRKTGYLHENPELYNRLRSVIGDKLDTTSQTYRNSDYTIFIRVGSTGGSEAVMQDAIQVWGQFNGTNLADKDHKFELSSGRVVGAAGQNDQINSEIKNNENSNLIDFGEDSELNHRMVIPVGATYTINTTNNVLAAGEQFPEKMSYNDFYICGDYKYVLMSGGWGVYVLDKGQTSYGHILESINGVNVTRMDYTFSGCSQLVDASNIIFPPATTRLFYTFDGCGKLKYPPKIPNNVVTMNGLFQNCHQLKVAPVIPNSVTNMYKTFDNCISLEKMPVIPDSVTTDISDIFIGCTQFGY